MIIAGNSSTGMSLEQIIAKEVNDWRSSGEYEFMLTADRYYKYEQDILNRKREVIGADGSRVETELLTNTRLQHGFMRKLVDQKVGYLLSNPPIVSTNEGGDEKPIQKKLAAAYNPIWDKLSDIGTRSIKMGRGWLTVYYDEEGNFRMKVIPAYEGIPLWSDAAHTHLQAFIRAYDVTVFEGTEETTIVKVEWWTPDDVKYYVLDGDTVVPDIESAELEGWHYKDSGASKTWGRVPFICFKYNPDEQSLLAFIKGLIDEYNQTRSDLANVLADGQFDMLIFKELGDVDLEKAIINMNTYRAVSVGADGDVETLGAVIKLEAIALHLKQLRKDIYEFGRGVDTQSENVIGAAPSGVALRFLYADLDMDCNTIESQFTDSLKNLLYFISEETGDSYEKVNIEFTFNRSSIINEVEIVGMASNSKGIISDETILANHPWVDDPAKELERLTNQQTEAAKRNAAAFGMDKT